MLPTDFSTWTKEQWNEFESIKQAALSPTQEEIDAYQAQQETNKQNAIAAKLYAIGEAKPSPVTKEYIIYLLEKINAQQFVGEDLSTWVDNQTILFGDIETAFDDLVFRYL